MTRDIVLYLFATRSFDESIDLASAQEYAQEYVDSPKTFLISVVKKDLICI
jgi:hypothetical protein